MTLWMINEDEPVFNTRLKGGGAELVQEALGELRKRMKSLPDSYGRYRWHVLDDVTGERWPA